MVFIFLINLKNINKLYFSLFFYKTKKNKKINLKIYSFSTNIKLKNYLKKLSRDQFKG